LEGYFKLSNYGRVKRMEFSTIFKNGAQYLWREKIICPFKTTWNNKYVGDQLRYLGILVTLEGRKYQFSLARMVYHCFVKKIDFKDRRKVIMYKDDDRFNILPHNLYEANPVHKSEHSIASGRFRSPLYNLTAEQRKQNNARTIARISKPVSQYGEDGCRINTYTSISEAGRKTGIHLAAIGKVANGTANGLRAGKYYWRFGKAARIPVKQLKKDRLTLNRTKHARPVSQYNMKGERIAVFLNTSEAAEKTGIFRTLITNMLNGLTRSVKGYLFRRGIGPGQIKLDGYLWGKEAIAKSNSARYRQYTLEGCFVKEYQTAKEAAAAVNRSSTCIVEAAKGITKHSAGYKWKKLLPKAHKKLGGKIR
jgi:hypothetical protein